MKTSRFIGCFLALIVTLGYTSLAYAQTLPDYSSWPTTGPREASFVIDGKDVKLQVPSYRLVDTQARTQKEVNLLNNENKALWLALYVETSFNAEDKITDMKVSLFERQNDKWVFVKDLSNISTEEADRFLKEKYKLEIK